MRLEVWSAVIALRSDVQAMLNLAIAKSSSGRGVGTPPAAASRGLPPDPASSGYSIFLGPEPGVELGSRGAAAASMQVTIDPELLRKLRASLAKRIDELKLAISKHLNEGDIRLVMLPLVLLCDELVMSRLPKEQHTLWPLLQSELFQFNYGGDVFYEFTDEQIGRPDVSPTVLAILYYCLNAGFVGKYGAAGGKVAKYKTLLSERIPGALPSARTGRTVRRRARPKTPDQPPTESVPSEGATPSTRRTWVYWAVPLGVAAGLSFLLVLFTNL